MTATPNDEKKGRSSWTVTENNTGGLQYSHWTDDRLDYLRTFGDGAELAAAIAAASGIDGVPVHESGGNELEAHIAAAMSHPDTLYNAASLDDSSLRQEAIRFIGRAAERSTILQCDNGTISEDSVMGHDSIHHSKSTVRDFYAALADKGLIEWGAEKKTENSMTATQTIGQQRSQTMTATPNEEKKPNFYETLTANIVKNLDTNQGLLPNQQLPFNAVTGQRYTGANMLALAAQNRPQNQWLSYSQVNAAGGKVTKGEQGTQIQFWAKTEKLPDGSTINLNEPKLSYMTVFNIAQTTLTNFNAKTPERSSPENFIAAFKVEHNQEPNARPGYNRDTDTITMPPPNRFNSAIDYQRAVVEQIANRQEERYSKTDAPTPGTHEAAAKEMKVKIAAAVIGDSIGIGHTADLNNSIYNNHWKKLAVNHPQDLTRTAAMASSIAYAAVNESKNVAQDRGNDMAGEKTPQLTTARMNLDIKYTERADARAAGCRWDGKNRVWYAPAGTDLNNIAKWPEKRALTQGSTPRDDLANTMQKIGFVVSGNHPMMDGNSHRIETIGDKGQEQSGYYRIHGDGVPAGYMKNHRTGEETKWKAQNYTLTPEMKDTLKKEAVEKYALREEEITKKQEQVAARMANSIGKMTPITERTEYMAAKGIDPEPGVYKTVDKSGNVKMAVPLTDINGKVWSMTNIAEDGTKTYAKDGKKHGSFHVVGGIAALKAAPAVIMAEGYATAVSLKNGLNTPVVAAMDAGNLLPVAQEMRKAFPEKAIVICGDDDRKLMDNPQIGKNVGKEKAMEAALAVGGQAVFPLFPKGTDNQLSDFNDLATKTELGVGGLKQQTEPAIKRAINNKQAENASTIIKETVKQRDIGKEKDQARERLDEKAKDLQREKEKIQDKPLQRGGRSL